MSKLLQNVAFEPKNSDKWRNSNWCHTTSSAMYICDKRVLVQNSCLTVVKKYKKQVCWNEIICQGGVVYV